MPKIITAIDLGNGSFKGIVAEQMKDDRLSVITAFKQQSCGFRKGVLVDFDEAYESLREICDDIKKISKKTVGNVFINVQSEHIKSRFSRGAIAISNVNKEIKLEDIEKVNQLSLAFKSTPGSSVIHNLAREYIIDDVGDIIDPLGMQGNRLEVETLIIEGVTAQINPILKLFNDLGVAIGGIVFNPIAAADAVLSKKQKNLGALLVDFGFGTTNVAVYDEGKLLYAKTIPIGSSYITNDIAIGLKVPVEVAEKLKISLRDFSTTANKKSSFKLSEVEENVVGEISKKFLSEIVEVRLSEILDLIDSELKVIGRSVHLPAGVIATGGGAKLYKLEEILKDKLRLPAQVGFPNLSNIEVLNPSLREMIEEPEFSVAVGLLLRALEENKKEMSSFRSFKDFLRNLLP